ncbi:hypothetical protein FA95DRAFT_1612578 [Auriscalpium vulgare]|uniref:Uncharacterized protein n=2 Tax=Auriscalpium vulgare TaxID=40419 RepID=A0ACB8R253_9AGAM|nr:hypothetical protein FA95DRAFT_1613745 [Auriscalpium vulgare]KAI0039438.1 hypothetical protein FA95DRAFT_1612578 [Auriscalpium vulgare]
MSSGVAAVEEGMEDHKGLAEMMHNLLAISLSPNIPASSRNIPEKYNIGILLWTHAFHRLLENLRRSSLNSRIVMQQLQYFIYYVDRSAPNRFEETLFHDHPHVAVVFETSPPTTSPPDAGTSPPLTSSPLTSSILTSSPLTSSPPTPRPLASLRISAVVDLRDWQRQRQKKILRRVGGEKLDATLAFAPTYKVTEYEDIQEAAFAYAMLYLPEQQKRRPGIKQWAARFNRQECVQFTQSYRTESTIVPSSLRINANGPPAAARPCKAAASHPSQPQPQPQPVYWLPPNFLSAPPSPNRLTPPPSPASSYQRPLKLSTPAPLRIRGQRHEPRSPPGRISLPSEFADRDQMLRSIWSAPIPEPEPQSVYAIVKGRQRGIFTGSFDRISSYILDYEGAHFSVHATLMAAAAWYAANV